MNKMVFRAYVGKTLVSCLLIFVSMTVYGEVYNQSSSPFFKDIPNGAIVEGSVRYSGLQPDYILDTDSAEFNELWVWADEIRTNKSLSVVEKVNILINRVRNALSEHRTYTDPVYIDLLNEYRKKAQPIPLSQYIARRVGVCRENALLLHLVLKRAGIPNSHVYAKTDVTYSDGQVPLPEGHPGFDHAFVVFTYKGERWIADSYFTQFNGYSFDEFMENQGQKLTYSNRKLPFAEPQFRGRAILGLNSYPQFITPKAASCPAVFKASSRK